MQAKQRHRTTTTLDVRAVGVDEGRGWAKNRVGIRQEKLPWAGARVGARRREACGDRPCEGPWLGHQRVQCERDAERRTRRDAVLVQKLNQDCT
jgi:hypothetical protein